MVRLAIEGRSACDQRARAFRSSEGPRLGGATANPEPPMILFELDHFGSIIAVATATLKLPNRRRIVFSDGRIAASVQLWSVGSEPCSATNLRRAATASAIRVSAMSGIGTASPSNTPGGFALWELRSTTQHLVSIKPRCGVGAGFVVACCAVSDMTTGLVTIQIGCCPSLDAMNTGHAAVTWLSTGRDRIDQGAAICARMASLQRGLG